MSDDRKSAQSDELRFVRPCAASSFFGSRPSIRLELTPDANLTFLAFYELQSLEIGRLCAVSWLQWLQSADPQYRPIETKYDLQI